MTCDQDQVDSFMNNFNWTCFEKKKICRSNTFNSPARQNHTIQMKISIFCIATASNPGDIFALSQISHERQKKWEEQKKMLNLNLSGAITNSTVHKKLFPPQTKM